MDKFNIIGKTIIYVILTACSLLFLLPLIWMLSTALKPLDQTMIMPPQWLPYQYTGIIEDKETPVKIVQKFYEPSVLIKIKESGKELVVPQNEIKNGFLIEKNSTHKTEVEILKKIPADMEHIYVKIIPEIETFLLVSGDEDMKYNIVPASSISRKINFRWKNFYFAVKAMKFFPDYLKNTLALCFLCCLGTVFSSAFIAYGFSKIDWRGRDWLFMIVLSTMMIPFAVTMVPLYALFRHLGLIGTLQPLWIGSFFGGAFNIFLLRQFFFTIPNELCDAARIDGCSEFKIFTKIVLPMSKPVLLVVCLFQFIATWNDFLGPLIYLTEQRDYTLSLGLQFFQSQHGGTSWNYMMAASAIMILPVIVIFFFTQKSFIEGISTTGFKG